jgi:amino acid transporter
LNYTGEQEFLAPQQARLFSAINARGGVIPAWFSEEYHLRNRRMTKWFSIMTVNTRMLFLFVLLFLGKPTWYFLVDLTLLNFVLAFVLVRQNRTSGDLLVELENRSS